MNRTTFLLSLIALILKISFTYSQDAFKGGFLGCNVYKCYFKEGAWDTTIRYIAVEYSYNENGNKTKEIQHDIYGTLSYFWKYDDVGNETEYRWVHNTGTYYDGNPDGHGFLMMIAG